MNTLLEKCVSPPIKCFENVTHYEPLEGPEFAWNITYEKEALPEDNEKPIYFVLDAVNQAAFSHWVYESATWLPIYKMFQGRFKNFFIVIEDMKSFKKLFLRYYGIEEDRLCLRKDMNPNNYCFFHTYISLNDKSIPDVYFYNLMEYKHKVDTLKVEKDIPLLYLPRGMKENYVGPNNRTYGIQQDLKDYVKQLGGTVYETDTTLRLEDQIQMVKRAKVIVLDYGSNLWVNGYFAENSKIICLNIGWHQHPHFPSFAFVWNEIHKTNVVDQIFAYPSDEKTEDGIAIVKFHYQEVFQKIHSSL